jgi:MAF protein
VVETPQTDEQPAALVTRLSQAKARAACSNANPQITDAIIIGCDTVVALDGELLGKPRNAAEATTMLRRLREQSSHAVYSAVTLLKPTTNRVLTAVAETQLTMRNYTNAEIAAYVTSGDPMDKAGAYAIQHPGFHPVDKLQGCYANVMGLPLCHLTRRLRALGIQPPRDVPAACQTHTGRHCSIYATILDDQ